MSASNSFTFPARTPLSDVIHATAETKGVSVSALIRDAIERGLHQQCTDRIPWDAIHRANTLHPEASVLNAPVGSVAVLSDDVTIERIR